MITSASLPLRGSLPVPRTRLIGREAERANARLFLIEEAVRLLTLVGPGGVGKTRLALAIAGDVAGSFADGLIWVDLSPLRDATLVPAVVAQALDDPPGADLPIVESLVRSLRARQTLLLLDNCEHLLRASGDLVSVLLATCPDLQVLATSRAPLRIQGEQEFPVDPLPLPSPEAPSLDALTRNEAVQLFVNRSRTVRPDFALTESTAPVVAALCRQLDGLPLAIELAAARSKLLDPHTLLAAMSDRFHLLSNGPWDAPPRLQTMRNAIAWSHELLPFPGQVLFRRLAVFAGGFTLAGTEAVGATGELGIPTLEGVTALVDQNLLRVKSGPESEPRFEMLETIREFGLEQLEASGEADDVRARHAEFFLALAERTEVAQYVPEGPRQIAGLTAAYPNLRVALMWFAERGDADRLLRLAAVLGFYWFLTGSAAEGRAWLERAVALGRTTGSPDLARGLVALAREVHRQGDEVRALSLAEEGLVLARAGDDPHALYRSLINSGLITLRLGDLARAAAFQTEALAVLASLGEALWAQLAMSTVLGHLGNIAVARGDAAGAEAYFTEALARQREQGFAPGTSHIMASHPLAGLGDVARIRGDHRVALDCYQEALRLARGVNDTRATAYALGGVAGTLAAAGHWELAARLFGAAEALHERTGLPFGLETMDRQRALGLPEPWQRATESFGAGQPLRDALGDLVVTVPTVPDPEAAAVAWATGRCRDLQDALDEALSVSLASAPPRAGVAGTPEHITPREVEVLRLLVEGKTDREIAAALRISRRTAATHVARIYGKLGVGSRAAAAAWAVRNGLV